MVGLWRRRRQGRNQAIRDREGSWGALDRGGHIGFLGIHRRRIFQAGRFRLRFWQ